MTTITMTVEQAFACGWGASSRTKTYDMDAAEDRFRARANVKQFSPECDAFTAGWTYHASGEHESRAQAFAAYAFNRNSGVAYPEVKFSDTDAALF